jgi:hypothetical protein
VRAGVGEEGSGGVCCSLKLKQMVTKEGSLGSEGPGSHLKTGSPGNGSYREYVCKGFIGPLSYWRETIPHEPPGTQMPSGQEVETK